ncbi:daf-6 [Cordylochernes scorpioides]|uniref:Daf-6 n=1 Tax=Cordylochernes scorpioides TaxID=51811 RepID=A0ABY6LM34_9ARAC|nr:daf-6 [Cordylochernes scorpioides]
MTAIQLTGLARVLKKNFHRLGILQGTYPWLFILGSILTFIFCFCGFFLFTIEMDFVTLFSVTGSPSLLNQKFIESTFPTNNHDNFEIKRFTNVKNTNRLIITAIDNSNILRQDIFNEVVELDKIIREIEFQVPEGPYSNKTLKYKDICSKYADGKCYANPVLKLSKSMTLLEENKHTLKYPFEFDVFTGNIVEYASSLGGAEVDSRDFLISAKAIALFYFNSPKYENILKYWETKLMDVISSRKFTNIKVSTISFNIMGNEMLKTALYAIPYFVYCSVFMGFFAFITCSYGDCVVTKSWVGVIGLIVATMSGLAGFGFCQYFGIPCAPPSIAILYVILGIGMDDVYVMLEAWKRSDPERTVAQRMGETMEHAGISITISSLTNCICFLIGAAAPLKFSYYFCMYAAACVFFDYVLTVSVVGAVIVLLARGEARPLHAVLFIPFDTAAKLCKSPVFFYTTFITGIYDVTTI